MTGRPSANDSSSAADGAPGLGEQFGRTKDAFLGLIAAHIKMAKAELSEIGGEIKRAVALGGTALILFFLAGMLIVNGLLLFLGEAVFGSIGWGMLDGAELLIGLAVLLILAIIDLSPRRVMSAFIVALGVGLVVFGLLAYVGTGLRVASALGVAALLLIWPIVAAVLVFRHGVDTAKLRKRFVPEQTIETTKETIEWVREQMPLGRKS